MYKPSRVEENIKSSPFMYMLYFTYDMGRASNTFVSFIHCTSDSPNIFHGMKFSPIKNKIHIQVYIYITQCRIGKYFWFLFFFCCCCSVSMHRMWDGFSSYTYPLHFQLKILLMSL